MRKSWGGVLEKADILNFRWHDLRHHFASMLVMAGVDLNTVRELLGHADISTTLRYAHLAPEHKSQAVEKIVKSRNTDPIIGSSEKSLIDKAVADNIIEISKIVEQPDYSQKIKDYALALQAMLFLNSLTAPT